jgi:hypothetical protein
MRPIVTFCNFANVSKNVTILPLRQQKYSTDIKLGDFDTTGSFKKRACYLTERKVTAAWYLF